MKKLNKIEIIAVRMLGFIPVVIMAFVGAMRLFILWVINFVRYGGEMIVYMDINARKNLQDIYNKLVELEKGGKL